MARKKNSRNQKKKARPDQSPPLTVEGTASQDTPTPGTDFPIVGIGASAGGLAAFESFFSGMPTDADPDMAFVLVQHLAPDHKSILTELIQRYTRMRVSEVEDGMVVHANCVYIIPPGHDMAFLNGELHLMEPLKPRGQRLPIDFFFRSLAQDQHERAIGIVLSGTGSDGTLGVRAIKGEGGMVMAQKPSSTEFDGMPSTCINTGLVDYILAPAEMAIELIAYSSQAFSSASRLGSELVPTLGNALNKIFIIVRGQTGHDFSQYKSNSTLRRIKRRMAVHQIETLEQYIKYIQHTPDEVEALFRDLLIGVTSFFRDPEVFKILEEVMIPKIFEGKAPGSEIRIWTAGCSTGEEAYSIAILLVEYMLSLKQSYAIQVFATDIDSQAISTARTGLYPASVVNDISPERLARFFTVEGTDGSYHIHKSIRDLMVFSEQDLIKDPPFSRLDLISCRNLLIYMSPALQKKVLHLFYYALKPEAILFLGISEGIGESGDLFGVEDRKSKLFMRKIDIPGRRHRNLLPRITVADMATQLKVSGSQISKKSSLRELAEQSLLKQIAPGAMLVNDRGDLLFIHGHAGMFLELASGETGVNNILKMAREGLRSGLSSTLRKAVANKEITSCQGLRMKAGSSVTQVDVTVHPVSDSQLASATSPLYLVILKETPLPPANDPVPIDIPEGEDHLAARIQTLQNELQSREDDLRSTQEELERSNEEFKSFNEELQSVNEELQSTNEELETSKEEMQSVNEELATVNSELQIKVSELSQVNNDMNNLLAGTGIATVFVDTHMNIMRFTPYASQIIHLIESDQGRPLGHIVSNLVNYNQLAEDIQAVIETLIPKELEVQTREGTWFLMRIQPYRTIDNLIEGAVISFIDITEMVRTRDALHEANEQLRLAVVVCDSSDAITVQDLDGVITAWNPSAKKLYGWSEDEALQMNTRERIPQELREQELDNLAQLNQSRIPEAYHTQRITKDGKVIEVAIIASLLINEAKEVYAIATTEREVP